MILRRLEPDILVMDFGVLTFFLLLTALVVSWIIYRLLSDRLWMHSHLRVLGLIFLVPFLVWGGIVEYQFQSTQSQLTAALKVATGMEDATVNCQRFTETFIDTTQHRGSVKWSAPTRVELKQAECKTLHRLLTTSIYDEETLRASHVFSHEAIHVLGERNEANTECYAIQQDQAIWELLGGEPLDVPLGETYYETYYPNMPSNYRSSECSPENPALHLTPNAPFFLQSLPPVLPDANKTDETP